MGPRLLIYPIHVVHHLALLLFFLAFFIYSSEIIFDLYYFVFVQSRGNFYFIYYYSNFLHPRLTPERPPGYLVLYQDDE